MGSFCYDLNEWSKISVRRVEEISSCLALVSRHHLSSHEKICAERMALLIKSIDALKKNVDELKIQVAKGKGAVAVLVFLGTIVAGIFGYLNIK